MKYVPMIKAYYKITLLFLGFENQGIIKSIKSFFKLYSKHFSFNFCMIFFSLLFIYALSWIWACLKYLKFAVSDMFLFISIFLRSSEIVFCWLFMRGHYFAQQVIYTSLHFFSYFFKKLVFRLSVLNSMSSL